MSSIGSEYLGVVIKQLEALKSRAEEAFTQLSDEELHWKPSSESNNVAILIQHLSGNMNSRWSGFLTTDGEKNTRDRDKEFVDLCSTRESLMEQWNGGWKLLLETIKKLKEDDLQRIVILRNNPISVLGAIQIEIVHISNHIGQILYIGKQIKDSDWIILSIPKNGSKEFNNKVSAKDR
ncbi:DUF1572 domain-containing protein [Rossellomorea vietnamensis]|uniref:DUF1572 domain-containing protein n=1 Tax=Rossellomorea vietnamensis TaxID=218284 RepID=A0A5D4MA33_9BACI|nr:DUF1572 family protein [Rossellomorea vietnamensis]TYR98287.1 DUF1572 domain-containing protein [Rossellomorea vietnamensis]